MWHQIDHTPEIWGFFGNLVNHPTITFFTDFFRVKNKTTSVTL